jgi:hypothetical protein
MAKGIFNKKTLGTVVKALGPSGWTRGWPASRASGNWEANSTFIFERSAEMRHRMNEIERDVREQLREIHLKLADPATGALRARKLALEQRAYQGIAMLDYASAAPTWMGAYLKGMSPKEKGGLEPGRAGRRLLRRQDSAQRARGRGRQGHGRHPARQRVPEAVHDVLHLLEPQHQPDHRHRQARGRAAAHVRRCEGTGDWAGFRGDVGTLILRSFAYTLGVQAVHHMMHPPKEEDGDEGWLKWFGKQMAMSAFGGVPILRDIVGHYAGGKDYEMSPSRRSSTTPTASPPT